MRQSTARSIQNQLKLFEQWPGNKAYWLKPDGSRYKPGETIKLPALARTLQADGRGRACGQAQRTSGRRHRARAIAFTKATSRARWWRSSQKHGAPFDTRDFAEFFARIEEPAQHDLSRLHRLQARVRQPGSGAAADAEHPGERSICARWAMPVRTTSTRSSRR